MDYCVYSQPTAITAAYPLHPQAEGATGRLHTSNVIHQLLGFKQTQPRGITNSLDQTYGLAVECVRGFTQSLNHIMGNTDANSLKLTGLNAAHVLINCRILRV